MLNLIKQGLVAMFAFCVNTNVHFALVDLVFIISYFPATDQSKLLTLVSEKGVMVRCICCWLPGRTWLPVPSARMREE